MTIAITFQVDSELYQEFEIICKKNNLTIEESFSLFLSETVRQGKLPFDYTEADLQEAISNPCVIIK